MIGLTDLAYHHAETAQEQAAQAGTFADLNEPERELYNKLKRDIQGGSILTILQRRRSGEYRLVIAPESCHISGALDSRGRTHRSAVLLDESNKYCTYEHLDQLARMVCNDSSVEYLGMFSRGKATRNRTVQYFVYRVRY